MADVSSLGQYKVVVTADYSQLKAQFEAMTQLVQNTTKAMTETIDKSMASMNTAMNTQLKSMVTSMQNAFNGAGTTIKGFGESVTKVAGETAKAGETVRKSSDGFKTYAQQVNAAERETQKAFQKLQDLQNKLQVVQSTPAKSSSDYLYRQNEEQKIEAAIRAQQAEYDRLRQKLLQLKAAQEQYKNSVNQTEIAAKQANQALVQGAKDQQNLMRQNARLLQGEMRSRQQAANAQARATAQESRQQQQLANAQSRRIAQLQTQYRVAYEEANKYLQSHTKMSEAVFIRLQGRLTAIGNEIRRLGALPPMTNPLEGMNFDQYASQFSRLADAAKSLKHHMTWMASAVAIGGIIGIPVAVSKAIESFEALQTKITQNLELANQYAGDTGKLHSAVNQMGEAAKVYAKGFGYSLAEVQDVIQILTRRYKDADTAIYLTGIALKMAKLDMIDTQLAAKDLEAVLLQFGMGAKDAGQFLNDFSVACHVARTSGTDMLMALERSGSAFAATNMGVREAIAAITAVSTVTGKTGATIGDSWKSILANLDFKKAQAALEAYNIKLYEVGKNGEKVQRQGAVVLTELLQQYAKLDDEGQKKLATAIAGGRRKLAA